MAIRHRRIFAVAATAAVLLAVSAPASAAPSASTTSEPASAAAVWLAQQFVGTAHVPAPDGDHFEGSFGSPIQYFFDGGTTADAIFALAAAKDGKTKIDHAIAYFEAHVAEYTSVNDTSGAPGPSDGQVAKTALAAIVAGADPTSFGGFNLLQALKDDQCTAVSGSSTDFTVPTCPAIGAGRNIFSSVSESLVILAEARAGGTFAPSAAAIAYLLSLQCPNGGFTGLTSACTDNASASVDETGYAAAALIALGGQTAALGRATDWLVSQRNAAGYWVAQGGPDVDSTGLAASALDAAGADTSTSRAWLATQQVSTGPSAGALLFNGAANVKATADGLLGLVHGASLTTLHASVLPLAPATAASASVVQGGTQTVTGLGFSPNEPVSAVLHSAPLSLASVTAGVDGTAVVTFTVPKTLPAGTHSVVLTGAISARTTTAAFTVTAARAIVTVPTTSTPVSGLPILAATGLDGQQALLEALIGLGLVAAGAGALYLGQRRRT